MTDDEPYPHAPDFYFGVSVPERLKPRWAGEEGHQYRMGILDTLRMVAQSHDISQLQDDWRHMCHEDADRRTAWLRGER